MATQEQVFLRWVELNLKAAGTNVTSLDITSSFQDGILLGTLIEQLTGKSLPTKLQHNGKNKLQMVTNIGNVLKFIGEQGVRVTLSAEDVYDGKDKLILGLLWVLILKFQVKSRDLILRWAQAHLASCNIIITNFGTDWISGAAFRGLCISIQKDHEPQLPPASTPPAELLDGVFQYIERTYQIPVILDAASIAGGQADERSILTYLSFLYNLRPELPGIEPEISKAEFEALQRRCAHLEESLTVAEEARQQITERATGDLQKLINNHRRTVEQLRIAREANEQTRKRIQELTLKFSFMGVSVNSIAPPSGTVTLVQTSVEGAAELWSRSPQTMADSLALHNQILRSQLSLNHGYEVLAQGDAFSLAFSSPLDAIHFCLAVQDRLLQAEWPEELLTFESTAPIRYNAPEETADEQLLLFQGFRVRMAIHSGTAVLGKGTDSGAEEYLGPASVGIVQLSNAARPGEILVSGTTLALLEEHQQSNGATSSAGDLPAFSKASIGKFRVLGIEPNCAGVERDGDHLVTELSHIFCVAQQLRSTLLSPFTMLTKEEREQEKLQDEIEKIRRENENLQSELQRTSDKARAAQQKAEELNEWMDKMRQDFSRTQKQQIEQVYSEVAQLLTTQQELRQELAAAREQQQLSSDTMNAMSTRLRTLTSMSGKLKRQYTELAEQHTMSLARIQELETIINSQPEKVGFLQRLLGKGDKKKQKASIDASGSTLPVSPRSKSRTTSKSPRAVESNDLPQSVDSATTATTTSSTMSTSHEDTPESNSNVPVSSTSMAESTDSSSAAPSTTDDQKKQKLTRRRSVKLYVESLLHKDKRHSHHPSSSSAESPPTSPPLSPTSSSKSEQQITRDPESQTPTSDPEATLTTATTTTTTTTITEEVASTTTEKALEEQSAEESTATTTTTAVATTAVATTTTDAEDTQEVSTNSAEQSNSTTETLAEDE